MKSKHQLEYEVKSSKLRAKLREKLTELNVQFADLCAECSKDYNTESFQKPILKKIDQLNKEIEDLLGQVHVEVK